MTPATYDPFYQVCADTQRERGRKVLNSLDFNCPSPSLTSDHVWHIQARTPSAADEAIDLAFFLRSKQESRSEGEEELSPLQCLEGLPAQGPPPLCVLAMS